MGMAVRRLLSSGDRRTIDGADSARLDGPFFLVRRSYPDLNSTETVLTLRSDHVIAAEVLKDGLRIDYIAGRGPTKVGKDVSAMDEPPRFVPDRERSPGTLGAVLYASPSKAFVSEAEIRRGSDAGRLSPCLAARIALPGGGRDRSCLDHEPGALLRHRPAPVRPPPEARTV